MGRLLYSESMKDDATKDWRYERKFQIKHLNRAEIEAWALHHPAGFRKSFPNRWVNNIYYDTQNLICYAENVAGVNQRNKYRIRWYGAEFDNIVAPTLEIKMKYNELGAKYAEKINVFELDKPPDLRQISDRVRATQESYMPTLMNRYERSYYFSADKKFRMTIDDQLCFLSPDQKLTKNIEFYKLNDVIIELKYHRSNDPDVSEITRHFPFRQTKNSKYVSGMLLTQY